MKPQTLQHPSKSAATMLLALLAMTLFSACSPKPSSEETAAQNKAVVEQAVEEAKQAMIAEQAAKEAEQEAVIAAKAAEKAAVAAAKKELVAERRAAAAKAKVVVAKAVCANCGIVEAVNVIVEEGKGSGVGVVAGGVVGGLLGNQVGQGSGRDAATVAGVVGGALIGNKIEKNRKKTTSYDIVVTMDNGTQQTIRQATDPALSPGQKVKIENGVVVKN